MVSHEFPGRKKEAVCSILIIIFLISFFPGGKKFLILLQVLVLVGDKRNQTLVASPTLPTKQNFLLPLPSLALLLTRTQKVMHIPVLLPSAVCAGEVGQLLSLSLRNSAVMHIPVFLPSAVCAGDVGQLLSLSLSSKQRGS